METIFAPADAKAFIAQSFHRSLLRLPGQAGRFAPLLDWDGLSRLLEWTPQAPRIELARGGRTIGAERFLTGDEEPRIDAGGLSLELEQGARARPPMPSGGFRAPARSPPARLKAGSSRSRGASCGACSR